MYASQKRLTLMALELYEYKYKVLYSLRLGCTKISGSRNSGKWINGRGGLTGRGCWTATNNLNIINSNNHGIGTVFDGVRAWCMSQPPQF